MAICAQSVSSTRGCQPPSAMSLGHGNPLRRLSRRAHGRSSVSGRGFLRAEQRRRQLGDGAVASTSRRVHSAISRQRVANASSHPGLVIHTPTVNTDMAHLPTPNRRSVGERRDVEGVRHGRAGR